MKVEEAVLWLKRYQGYEPFENGVVLKHSFDLTDETVDAILLAIRKPSIREPLTLEQLREMDGKPVWVNTKAGSKFWGIVTKNCVSSGDGRYLWITEEDTEYRKTWLAYAYPPAHIDREAWKCPLCETSEVISFEAWEDESKFPKGPSVRGAALFCPHCGKPRTPEAWAEMKKRMGGISNG